MSRGTLRVAVGSSPIASEHRRLLRSALRRGDLEPEIAADACLEGSYSDRAIVIARRAWLERMLHEHQSAAVFSRLVPQLIEAEVDVEWKTVALRMSMDELRHASLCSDVVRLLRGEPRIDAELATEPLPEHPGCTPRERVLRNVTFACCLSETIAATLLAEERELTTEPAIRRVEEQLAADEILHGRYGWAFLHELWPSLDADARGRTARYLPVALGTIESKMLGAMPDGPPPPEPLASELEALGVTPGARARELLAIS
ncbi:MAG: ferritin-like domain-containing protein [Myxococcota bacterium]|nr:ferritin-like domain-containing protein [Myxococcota bacterium]